MTRRFAGSLGVTAVTVTGLVLLMLAVWGIARLDGDLRAATGPQRIEDREVRLVEPRCPHPHVRSRRT
jgi:hypothetical protein